MLSLPGLETAHRLARLRPRDQRERAAIERLRSWDGRMSPDSDRGDDLPGLHAAARPRGGPRGDRRSRPGRALARPRRQRVHRPRHLAVALAVPPADALGGGRRGADRPAMGRPRARRTARRARRARGPASGPIPTAWRWGSVHPLVFPHALGAAQPGVRADLQPHASRSAAAQETVAQVGWDPNDPFTAIWAPCWRMVADPARPERSRWQAFTGQSGHAGEPATTTTCRPLARRRPQPCAADGAARGPWRTRWKLSR